MRVLFLCTGNSCRSQMAEGFANAMLKVKGIRAWSAGIESHGLNLHAVKVMGEAGIDISHNLSKTLDQLHGLEFDAVVTVCDKARESCPVFPGEAKMIQRSFDDPPKLAEGAATEEEALNHYRRVRNEIRKFIEELPRILKD